MKSDEFKKGQLIRIADNFYRIFAFRYGCVEAIRLFDGIIITLDQDDFEHCSIADERKFQNEFTHLRITLLK